MAVPVPIRLFHITRLEHLPSIAQHGLCCDADAHADGRLTVEIGNIEIKDRRKHRSVPAGPGGMVADYAPFYFAERSPMLFAIHRGNVSTYAEGQVGVVYLCSTLERVRALGLPWVATDRNAVLRLAKFTDDQNDLADLIDWDIMRVRYWSDSQDDKERRQAELLVHRRVPWEAIEFIGTRTEADLSRVRQALATLEVSHVPRSDVRGRWYF
ncbi:MAG: DUF4433 domain-containing protein [Austwickia sp.]|nr:DUF4433 domain-containing protein [Austwickia sp.]